MTFVLNRSFFHCSSIVNNSFCCLSKFSAFCSSHLRDHYFKVLLFTFVSWLDRVHLIICIVDVSSFLQCDTLTACHKRDDKDFLSFLFRQNSKTLILQRTPTVELSLISIFFVMGLMSFGKKKEIV